MRFWVLLLTGCGGEEVLPLEPEFLEYAQGVVSFVPGAGAGYGQDRYPQVVLGPPQSMGTSVASLDVLSLGDHGEIVLDFGNRSIADGPGTDFVVFENSFYVRGDPKDPFAEVGQVSVSPDGQSWYTFPCAPEPTEPGVWPGCAGWRPTFPFDPSQPLEPEISGGDPFDLADLGLARARYVRIRDLSGGGFEPSIGFDLDAVGLVHWTE